jgi:phytoene dehydrogenase-like protein
VALFEQSDEIGGRVRTDRVDGFLLDHGFQVLQTGYDEAQRAFDYKDLKLSPFSPGAIIQTEKRRVVMADPWRQPAKLWATLSNGVGTMADRWKLMRLRAEAASEYAAGSFNGTGPDDCSTRELLLERYRFSSDFVDRFLRPWISGMFFDEQLSTSARFFKFVFHMLAVGDAALPEDGMHSLPKQLAGRLDRNSIFTDSPVKQVDSGAVELEDGSIHHAPRIVLAVPGHRLNQLLPEGCTAIAVADYVATECYYFATPSPPPIGKFLMLNGVLDGSFQSGNISNISVPSNVSGSYAPKNSSLVCVNVRPSRIRAGGDSMSNGSDGEGDGKLNSVLQQAESWFGSSVRSWQPIRSYRISQAIPRWPERYQPDSAALLPEGISLCGDYRESPSIQGALMSGKQTADAILKATPSKP